MKARTTPYHKTMHTYILFNFIIIIRSGQCARTHHARLGSTMPLTYHDWTHPVPHFIPYQVPSSTYLYVRQTMYQSQLRERRYNTYIYIKHPNHSWENVYDCGCTKNTLTALYTTDQQHVLIGSTYLLRNNDRRQGRQCTIVDDVPSQMMYHRR